jgi:hypothetical protein
MRAFTHLFLRLRFNCDFNYWSVFILPLLFGASALCSQALQFFWEQRFHVIRLVVECKIAHFFEVLADDGLHFIAVVDLTFDFALINLL